jgi:hypothetical protein
MTSNPILGLPRWLIEALVECMLDVTVFASNHDFLETDFNQDIAEFDLRELERSLLRGVEDDVFEIVEVKGPATRPVKVADEAELDRLIHKSASQSIWLGLTAKGGGTWEALYNARWDKYIRYRVERDDLDDCLLIVESMSRDRLATFCDNAQLLGYYRTTNDMEWTIISPWDVTYWKTFPSAHLVKFRCSESFGIAAPPKWLADMLRWHD